MWTFLIPPPLGQPHSFFGGVAAQVAEELKRSHTLPLLVLWRNTEKKLKKQSGFKSVNLHIVVISIHQQMRAE